MLDDWNQKIKLATQTQTEQRRDYEEKKRQILPQLIAANQAGVSTRQLEEITGINHTTIARWIKEAREKQNVQS
ncbi:hypothetical protein MUP01_08645 [Candidatus Bathyarchaeota archaeon]|nr:hypothetical protein [Candidatus Bathyarchaeota archaeon]